MIAVFRRISCTYEILSLKIQLAITQFSLSVVANFSLFPYVKSVENWLKSMFYVYFLCINLDLEKILHGLSNTATGQWRSACYLSTEEDSASHC